MEERTELSAGYAAEWNGSATVNLYVHGRNVDAFTHYDLTSENWEGHAREHVATCDYCMAHHAGVLA